ncbi:MAG: GNAT family N-acetyltransferase [Planctomycetota bacterium]
MPTHVLNTEIKLIAMRSEHVPAVVNIHLRCFPSFFLTFLGPRFLTLLYGEVLRQSEHVALVAVKGDGEVIGFVSGVVGPAGFYGRLARRRWFSFGTASLGAVLRRPLILKRLVRALWWSYDVRQVAAPAAFVSLAVVPKTEGRGVGRALVLRFLEEMRGKGVPKVSLVTDRDNNDRVNEFYCKLGFSLTRNFVTPEGRSMNEYVIVLESAPACSGP